MHGVCIDNQVWAGGYAHELMKVQVKLQSELLLVFPSVSVLNGWDRMHVKNDMHATAFPCMQSITLLTLSTPCQQLRWIYNLYGCSFIHEFMLCPLLYRFMLQLILSSMQLLFFLDLLLQRMQLFLYSIICLRVISMSHRHFIARVSDVAFITSGSAWACNFFLPLCCQQSSSCVCRMSVFCLLLLLMVLLVVMLLPSYLDVLVYEQLDFFIGRQDHRHLLGCNPRCALNGVLWLCSPEGHCTFAAER